MIEVFLQSWYPEFRRVRTHFKLFFLSKQAACQGVAELAQKLGKHPLYAEYLAPHVPMLLQVRSLCLSQGIEKA